MASTRQVVVSIPDTLADLPQTAQVVVAHRGELGDVMLHG